MLNPQNYINNNMHNNEWSIINGFLNDSHSIGHGNISKDSPKVEPVLEHA
jgi:hypothetical protein